MKHLLITLVAFFTLSGIMKAQEAEIADTVATVETTVETVAQNDRAKALEEKWDEIDPKWSSKTKKFGGFNLGGEVGENLIPIIAIIMIFGMPVFIVLIICLFRYNNQRARYRVVEKALESGRELPEDFFAKEKIVTDLRTKGIKNTFLGLGLGIFLWALTGTFGLGCIGFMIMLIGIGEIIIYQTQNGNNRN